jgi:hypothetical protein
MPAPLEAQATLEDARSKLAVINQTSQDARALLDRMVATIASGEGDVTPDDLARARAAVEHAELALPGAQRRVQESADALRQAEADDACDRILSGLRARGAALVGTYEPLIKALAAFARAAAEYDGFVTQALQDPRLDTASPRVHRERNASPKIDGTAVQRCRPTSQLCTLLVPALRELRAPQSFVEEVRMHGAGAPKLAGLGDR